MGSDAAIAIAAVALGFAVFAAVVFGVLTITAFIIERQAVEEIRARALARSRVKGVPAPVREGGAGAGEAAGRPFASAGAARYSTMRRSAQESVGGMRSPVTIGRAPPAAYVDSVVDEASRLIADAKRPDSPAFAGRSKHVAAAAPGSFEALVRSGELSEPKREALVMEEADRLLASAAAAAAATEAATRTRVEVRRRSIDDIAQAQREAVVAKEADRMLVAP